MKKIFGTIFLIFSVLILGFSQQEEERYAPLDSTIVDSLILQDSTGKQLNEIIYQFFSESDSGKVNLAIINVPPQIPEVKVVPQEDFLTKQYFTWSKFFLSSLFFLGLYFLLEFLSRVLTKYNFLGKFQSDVKSIIRHSLLVFEAVALLILGSAFVLIDPIYHGILAAIILAVGFSHIKNYFSGRIVQFDQSVVEGKRLKTLDSQGVIFKKGRLGLKLRTQKGVQFINYSSLISDGYTLLTGIEVGGFYELKIQPKDLEVKKDHLNILRDLFTTTPYLDMSHKPQLEKVDDESKTILARVEVKEESHLQDLVTLIKERNFSCQVIS
ncbi:MAG: hypothetical protein ACJAT4_002052 [Granulosicoccus sp.]|jgi:hypothetical protein